MHLNADDASSQTDTARRPLNEIEVVGAFHLLERAALSQAVTERLVSQDLLASNESDLQTVGPALVLFFAALAADPTLSPRVHLPLQPPATLRKSTCPDKFKKLFKLWALLVPQIKTFSEDYQHDIVRVICSLEPLTSPVRQDVIRISEALKALAIEISQRRSFLESYRNDLQYALDRHATVRQSEPLQASFRPPPMYAAGSVSQLEARPPDHPPPGRQPRQSHLDEQDPVMNSIRETLYSALADVIQANPALLRDNQEDPARTYYACTALATLHVCVNCITSDRQGISIIGPHGKELILRVEGAPAHLKVLVQELLEISRQVLGFMEEDSRDAINAIRREESLSSTRLDRLKNEVAHGLEPDELVGDGRPVSREGLVRITANKLNTFALHVTRLPAFKARAEQVFSVLRAFAS